MYSESPSRPLRSFPILRCILVPLYFPKSLSLNLFANCHPVTSVTSIFYKNMAGAGATPDFLPPSHHSTKFNRIIAFADPHPLTLFKSYRFKKAGGRAQSICHNSFPCHTSENSLVSPMSATDPKTHVSKPSICHTSETPGVPACQLDSQLLSPLSRPLGIPLPLCSPIHRTP